MLPKDRLFLLRPGFEDPAYPGERFFCWHCALLDGLVSALPTLTSNLDVEYIAWPRPRQALIDLVGADNQGLPLLVLASGRASRHETGRHGSHGFIAGKDAILADLSERHGFPAPHP